MAGGHRFATVMIHASISNDASQIRGRLAVDTMPRVVDGDERFLHNFFAGRPGLGEHRRESKHRLVTLGVERFEGKHGWGQRGLSVVLALRWIRGERRRAGHHLFGVHISLTSGYVQMVAWWPDFLLPCHHGLMLQSLPGVEWVALPTGRFEMGADVEPDPFGEGPPRLVTVGQFQITAQPITVGQFAAFVLATGFTTTAEREGSGFLAVNGVSVLAPGLSWSDPLGDGAAGDDEPVVQVSWFDVLAFAEWAGLALPTEAEREYVGFLDVLTSTGLAEEWVADWFSPTFHHDEQRVNPIGPDAGTERVVRQCDAHLRTKRRGELPDLCRGDLGFRLTARLIE